MSDNRGNVFRVGDIVTALSCVDGGYTLRVTDILLDGHRKVYECNDGNLYYGEDLEAYNG